MQNEIIVPNSTESISSQKKDFLAIFLPRVPSDEQSIFEKQISGMNDFVFETMLNESAGNIDSIIE